MDLVPALPSAQSAPMRTPFSPRILAMLMVPAGIPAAIPAATASAQPTTPASAPATPPEPIMDSFRVTDEDYPEESRRNGFEGVVRMAITIGPDGRITDCQIRQSSGTTELDERSCAIAVERFRFRPATRDGAAIESKAVLPLAWKLADSRGKPPPAQGQ
jgi:protein TonB